MDDCKYNNPYDYDPYFIPTVPRWKKDLFSQDLDETIGDKFFECIILNIKKF